MSKRHIPAIPCLGLSDFNSENFEWETDKLTAKEIVAMRRRLADMTKMLHEDDLRRVAAVADSIQEDREWLARYAEREKYRRALIKYVVGVYRAELTFAAKKSDENRVPQGVARRAVERAIGVG